MEDKRVCTHTQNIIHSLNKSSWDGIHCNDDMRLRWARGSMVIFIEIIFAPSNRMEYHIKWCSSTSQILPHPFFRLSSLSFFSRMYHAYSVDGILNHRIIWCNLFSIRILFAICARSYCCCACAVNTKNEFSSY